jgi:hypothetical protein
MKAPISNIKLDADKPIFIPHACRNSRINSEFGNGLGARHAAQRRCYNYKLVAQFRL